MGRMTAEEARLRDEAIAAGRVVAPVRREDVVRRGVRHPDRVASGLAGSRCVPVVRPAVRYMSVRTALEWAFGAEHARLDFDVTGVRAFDRVGVSQEWILAEVKRIGCRVDGGGQSSCHPDAELIAAAVEAVSVAVGGRQMAVVIAACARGGVVPDWRGSPRRRVVPCGWDLGLDGQWQAQVAPGPETRWRDSSRHWHDSRFPMCPVSYGGGAASVAAARRGYLDWWGALLEVRSTLQREGYLDAIRVTDEMPPLSPWKKGVDCVGTI